MVLSHCVKLPKYQQVLDLSAGCGTLGLLLCARYPGCRVTGVELDEQAHAAALDNIQRNALEARMESICADLRTLSSHVSPGSFPVCVSNPPYFSGGFSSQTTPMARQTDFCSMDDLCKAAGYALKYGGSFFVVQKPENLAHLIARAAVHKLEAKVLLLLRHRPEAPVSLAVLQFRKGGKPGLKIEEATLWDSCGNPTPYYKSVYHIE